MKINIDPETYLGSIEGMVILPSGYVLETTSALLPFFRETGDQYTSAEPPWPRMAEMSYLQRSGVIKGIGFNKWIFSFMFGNGWIVFESNRATATYSFVEHSEFPRIVVQRRREGLARITSTRYENRPLITTFDVTNIGDTLLILSAAGSSRRPVVDKYDIRTGQYLYSQALPGAAWRMDLFEDQIVTIDNTGLTPLIQAFQPKGEWQ